MYKDLGLTGGHMIILNKQGTPEYEASKEMAFKGLTEYPGGMQIGGGIDADNAREFIEAGASHVIVTSYIFDKVKLSYNKLDKLKEAVGKDKVVLDLSCRFNNDGYYVVTDRWQTFTELKITPEVFTVLGSYCDEFLVHGVDVEGLRQGIDDDLLRILAEAKDAVITYAGGVRSLEDIDRIATLGKGRIDYTIGSALDIFGGKLKMEDVMKKSRS
jgi:phosphoribosylformimino-5-aminoimidazole carboxamide ribotide isomerase